MGSEALLIHHFAVIVYRWIWNARFTVYTWEHTPGIYLLQQITCSRLYFVFTLQPSVYCHQIPPMVQEMTHALLQLM